MPLPSQERTVNSRRLGMFRVNTTPQQLLRIAPSSVPATPSISDPFISQGPSPTTIWSPAVRWFAVRTPVKRQEKVVMADSEDTVMADCGDDSPMTDPGTTMETIAKRRSTPPPPYSNHRSPNPLETPVKKRITQENLPPLRQPARPKKSVRWDLTSHVLNNKRDTDGDATGSPSKRKSGEAKHGGQGKVSEEKLNIGGILSEFNMLGVDEDEEDVEMDV